LVARVQPVHYGRSLNGPPFRCGRGPAISGVNADALIVVLTPELATCGDAAVDAAVAEAIAHGDLVLKAGRAVSLHRVLGKGRPKLVVAVASQTSPKAFKAAIGKALTLIKDTQVAHVAVAAGQGWTLDAGHARAIVQVADEATYVYRETKPSAPAAGALRKCTLVGHAQEGADLPAALKRAQGQMAGVPSRANWPTCRATIAPPPIWPTRPGAWHGSTK